MEADPQRDHELMLTRRQLFGRTRLGLGTAALAGLSGSSAFANDGVGLHHRARAKRVIYLFMAGGPSQHDMWDYKPKMADLAGKELPSHIRDGQRVTGMSKGKLMVMPSEYSFSKFENHDRGVWVSELLPHTAKVVKDLCVIHSVHTEAINHDPGITYIQTGSQIPGRPSLGAWLSYGLGSENSDLPGYVVMHSMGSQQGTSLFGRLWGSGFMPSNHQGVVLRGDGDAVLYLKNPKGVLRHHRRAQLDALASINQAHHRAFGDPRVLARLEQHEMAYRMQAAVPELMDLSQESESTWKLYGEKAKVPGSFEACCLNARRLAERGVRNIQVFHRGWDQHSNLRKELPAQCEDIDRGCMALITDLKQRGMLEDTLVVWGGEFGRTAYSQGKFGSENYGRDHHPRCFTMWMAGGGVKRGITYGQTDDVGYNIADEDGNPLLPPQHRRPDKHHLTPGAVHIHDLNATILHLLGIDHTRLTYRYQGRDFRLTDVHGHVVRDLLI
ncbi:MAG: DUF1501 domain-containing protein [Verrucomicrobiota bacterium]